MTFLANKKSREECLKDLTKEPFARRTVSFYRYVIIEDPKKMRDDLYREWTKLGVLGRIYIAGEGINAQINVPEPKWDEFVNALYAHSEFKDVPFKIATEDGLSFWKLTIKIKKQIVADGLSPEDYDVTNVGTHLSAEEFNQHLENGAIVVDMRNQYESRIGRFENAICPDVDTFREELPAVKEILKGNEDKKILLYCTGGIRCEKASAYLKHQGFKDVNQLHGGIIQYFHEVKQSGLKPRFKGANFVFDGRTAERITDDILTECDQCGAKSDHYTNCSNVICNLLFVQCEACGETMNHCCSQACKAIVELPEEEQIRLRKQQAPSNKKPMRLRVRPKIALPAKGAASA